VFSVLLDQAAYVTQLTVLHEDAAVSHPMIVRKVLCSQLDDVEVVLSMQHGSELAVCEAFDNVFLRDALLDVQRTARFTLN
jgi:hypothetical protein